MVEGDFEKMGQAEFPWRLVTVMSMSQRRMGLFFFFKPQGYIFPPWSQPLSRAVNTKALSKGPGTERKA